MVETHSYATNFWRINNETPLSLGTVTKETDCFLRVKLFFYRDSSLACAAPSCS